MRREPLITTFRLSSARTAWALAALFAAAPGLAAQTTFTVNSTNDADDGACDAAHCSLREAITSAIHTDGAKVIAFDIAGAGPHTISPTSELPAVEDSITVDGTTEPDFVGTPVIELDGSDAGPVGGLNVVGVAVTIRGLVVNRFQGNGIQFHSATTGNAVEGCYVGTDVTGTIAMGNGNAGVMVGQSSDNTIGGTTPGARNVISGNIEGVTIVDVTATGNRVLGNYIGTNAAGDAAIPNGVGILLLAPDNTVGGTTTEARNVISGNTLNGVDLGPPNAKNNVIQGNYIGLDASGSHALGNDVGVFVNRVAGNTIGGSEPGAGNVISANREGVNLWELEATGNRVIGNYVGTDATGVAAIPNEAGIMVFGPGNEVGGSGEGEGNLISGNAGPGVNLSGPNATGNRIQGNYIGTDGTGATALSNSGPGVFLISASDNTIGGTEPGARNILSGNEFGVLIATSDATGNRIIGNYIGTNASGDAAIPNQSGVLLWGFDNTIGGTEDGAGNVISGNTFAGIDMGEDTKGTVIQGNHIGTDASGMAAVGNDLGIFVNFAPDNTIGGTDAGAGNVISGNAGDAIHINGPKATGNLVQGNHIGTGADGTTAVGNGGTAIVFIDGASDNLIGGDAPASGNTIAHNGRKGVVLLPEAGTGNAIRSNRIFRNARFAIDLGDDGPTVNEPEDADTGPNSLQNYPILTAVASATGADVTAVLNSQPEGTYTIDVFSADTCRRTGTADGLAFGGTATLTTDASGDASVSMAITDLSGGTILTATATDANGNTSEFSTCAELSDFTVALDPPTNTIAAGQSATYTVTVSARGGFNEAVTLSCSGAPSMAECTFSESQVTPGDDAVMSTLTLTTTAPSTSLAAAMVWDRDLPLALPWVAILVMGLVTLAGLGIGRRGSTARRPHIRWLLATVVALVAFQAACGDETPTTPTPVGGTPPGTYELTITGAWGSLEHTSTTSLVVQ